MKSYSEIRELAADGDVLLVSERSLVGLLIRVLTGEGVNHVALLVWIERGLWVAEMTSPQGYKLRPASLWVADRLRKGSIWYGRAPGRVHGDLAVRAAALRYRDRGYGYLSLLKVWLAQVTRLNAPVRTLVCSTFVQRCWQAAGYRFRRTADPGDYLELCAAVIPIEPEGRAGG